MLRLLAFLFVVIPIVPALAADGGVAPASAVAVSSQPIILVDGGIPASVESPASAPASASAPAPESAPAPSVVEIAVDAKEVLEKGKAAIEGPTVISIAAALAALFLLIAKLARRAGKLLTQKQVNKVVAACSALALGASSITPGMPWWGAVVVGVSPLLFTFGFGDEK